MDLHDQLKQLFPDHEPDPDYTPPQEQGDQVQSEPIICKYEKKGRNGKPVTLLENLELNETEQKKLAKKLKAKFGIGGSVKDDTIVLQGGNRDAIMESLKEWGYTVKRVGG